MAQAQSAGGPDLQRPPPRKGSIFISYVREDADAARRLSAALADIGGDVWLDERGSSRATGGRRRSSASIRREVRLFLPIISQEHREPRGRIRIQGVAERRCERAKGISAGGRRFIVPVVIDRRIRRQPAQDTGRCRKRFATSHWGQAPGGPARCEGLRHRADGGDPRHAAEGGGMTAVAESLASRQLDRENPWPGLDSFEETRERLLPWPRGRR